ncbi:protein SIEVE ELEMENT OCCLUSION A-like [Pyrus communis]
MESLPENEVMTEELSVQLLTDDEQEQRMEMGVSDQGEGEGEGEGSERISLFDRSQNEIMKLIFAVNYRVPDEGHASFDVHAIFSTSQKIIKDSTKIIHNIIEQGSGFNDVETPKASSSFCTLINSFGCKMSCKSPGNENAFESRTEEILTKLSSYPCEVHVVLALAVFALEYEECSGQLSKKSTSLKRQDAVVELNNLVNQALQVIEHILELERLISGDRDSEPKLARVIMDTPFYAYWSIITLVACATELSLLTSDEDIKSYDLSHFSHKMGFILNKFEGQLTICQQEKEEVRAKKELWKLVCTAPPKITEVFQRLVLFKHKAYPQPPIISVNPTNKEVFNINVLEGKWVLFYISSLDNVSDQDISCLKEVYEGIEKHNKCVIVWIPVVEDWTGGGKEQFKEWRSKMPWYAVQYFSRTVIGYLEQRWNFKGNPMVVVMNRKGTVAIGNIIDLIRTQATEAIALLNVEIQKEIREEEEHSAWFGTTAAAIALLFAEIPEARECRAKGLSRTLAEAVVVLKSLTRPQPFTNTDATPVLLDGSNKQVNIDNELKWKDMFLLLSDVGIEDCYISYLKPVYEGIRRYPSYRIVWVPVVEQWNQDKEKQLEMSRLKMPWYTLKCFPTKPGIKYMKEKWNYKGKPAVVVMTSAGMVKNKNAFPLIKKNGMDAFPFFK